MYTFADPLNRALRIAPAAEAVVDGDTRCTFEQLGERCRRLVGGLYGLGLEAQDRVAILAANSAPYLESYLGIPAGNLVIVPLNTRQAEPELRYALEDSGARVLITDREPGSLVDVVEHVVSIPDGYASLLDGHATAAYMRVGPGAIARYTFAGTPQLTDLVPAIGYPNTIRFGATQAYAVVGYFGLVVLPL